MEDVAEETAVDQEAITLMATAERVLSEASGAAVMLGKAESLREKYRNRVLRCPVVSGPAGLPVSVIVKASVGEGEHAYDPEKDDRDGTAWRLLNEWAGNRFLNERSADPPLNARLLGGDRAEGLIVLEDLGSGNCLADIVQGSDPTAAENALFCFARALGRIHAETAGHSDEWKQIRLAIGGTEQEREREGARWLRESFKTFCEQCAELEVPLSPGLDNEAEAIRQTFDHPGAFDAFSPTDTCPDNHRLMPDGTLRFFDFEYAGFRHALLDAAYLRVPFPSCWCVNRLPSELVPRLEAAYRAELIHGCPDAQEDAAFATAMSHACAYWMIITLEWALKQSLEKDSEWGIATVRQRHLYRLETFAETTSRHGHLPALTETARALASRLASLWLPELEPMPIYPAFR